MKRITKNIPEAIGVVTRGITLFVMWRLAVAGPHPMFADLPHPSVGAAVGLTLAVTFLRPTSSSTRSQSTDEQTKGAVEILVTRLLSEIFYCGGVLLLWLALYAIFR